MKKIYSILIIKISTPVKELQLKRVSDNMFTIANTQTINVLDEQIKKKNVNK